MTLAPSAPAARFERSDWASSFRNVGVELSDVPVTAARGTIPAALVGTLYRNGPGRLERGGQWVHHPFDGDGNRFVRTEGWQAEEQAGTFVYRGLCIAACSAPRSPAGLWPMPSTCGSRTSPTPTSCGSGISCWPCGRRPSPTPSIPTPSRPADSRDSMACSSPVRPSAPTPASIPATTASAAW